MQSPDVRLVTETKLANVGVTLWKAATSYKQGQAVLSPTGVVVTALADFTSGSSYDTTKWSAPVIGVTDYNALINKPALGTAASQPSTAFDAAGAASAAQSTAAADASTKDAALAASVAATYAPIGSGSSNTLDRVRYVSTSGSDSNDGRSWKSAYTSVAQALSAIGGQGTIYIGAGTFTESGLVIGQQQRLVGAGKYATNLVLGASGTLINLTNQSDGAIRDLTLRFASSSVTGTLVKLSNSFRFLIDSVVFKGTSTAGQIGAKLDTNAGDSNFRACDFTALDIGVRNETTLNYFYGGSWFSNLTAGYQAGDPAGATRIGGAILDGITFLGTGAAYVDINGLAASHTIASCWFDGAATVAIKVGAAGTAYGPRQLNVRDCPYISGVSTNLLLHAAGRVVLDGNTFGNSGSSPTDISAPIPANVAAGYCGQNSSLNTGTIASKVPASWTFPVVGAPVSNLTATSDPTLTSDSAAGYAIGSQWINVITGALYQATSVAAGAAVWRRLTADVQIYTTPGAATWTKPPWASLVEVALIAGGGGGGSGARGASGTASSGGAGGAGGGYAVASLAASQCGSTESIQVGAGGNGGSAVAADSTAGSAGTGAASSYFSSKVRALGGGAGAGGGFGTTAAAGSGGNGISSGGSGGNGTSGTAGGSGGTGSGGAPGGGGGGGLTSAAAFTVGGASGQSVPLNQNGASGGSSAGAAGTNGLAAASQVATAGVGGGGGASSPTGPGGSGGTGGLYGAGGGGGGSSINGNASGAGGAGASGIVIVIAR